MIRPLKIPLPLLISPKGFPLNTRDLYYWWKLTINFRQGREREHRIINLEYKLQKNELTKEQWIEKYKPIQNPFVESPCIEFGIIGEQVEFVKNQNPLTIWTNEISDYWDYITNGFHFVNREAYYITEIPFDPNDSIEVILETPDQYFYSWLIDEGYTDEFIESELAKGKTLEQIVDEELG